MSVRFGVLAVGAISSLGRGANAYSVGERGALPRSAVQRDAELRAYGLSRALVARASREPGDEKEPCARLLHAAATQLAAQLGSARPGYRSERVAVVLGTSSAGLSVQQGAFRALARGGTIERKVARAAPYFAVAREVEAWLGLRARRVVQVLAACASSTLALGIGLRYLELGHCDLVIAGGYDAIDPLVAAGFEALGATTATAPRPFRIERDGLSLGEGAALLALSRTSSPRLGQLLGFGTSSDAYHATAPDPEGKGLASAALRALEDAALAAESIDLVSAHGTATSHNDAAEACALARVLGATEAVVHAFKGSIGHTLGAGGVLETIAALDALERGVMPASAGGGAPIPELGARLPEHNEGGTPRFALKLSAAFGGANAALVMGRSDVGTPRARRSSRGVALLSRGEAISTPNLARARHAARTWPEALGRADPLSALVLTAVAAIFEERASLPDGTGLIVGSVAATIEHNRRFFTKVEERGPARAPPRLFPATSPNLCSGIASIAFELRGPCMAVAASLLAPLEALALAVDFVRAGDAPAILVVAADEVGETVRSLWAAAGWDHPAPGAFACLIGASADVGTDVAPRVYRLLEEATPETGRLGGAEPGWPVLLRAFELAGGV